MYLALRPLCVVSSFSPWRKREGAAQGTFPQGTFPVQAPVYRGYRYFTTTDLNTEKSLQKF